MKPIACLIILTLLAACGAADNDPGPGGVTVGEARALDDAAAMIEARRLPPQDTGTPAPAPRPGQVPPQTDTQYPPQIGH